MSSRRLLLLPRALFLLLPLSAAPDQRVLALTAPALTDDTYHTQTALLLPAWTGLLERDFVILIQFGAKYFPVVLIGKDGGARASVFGIAGPAGVV